MYFSLYNRFGSKWPATLGFNSNSYIYNYFSADIATTFLAPFTGYYTFYICVDDMGSLYMSNVGVGVSETLLASDPTYCADGNFWNYKSQTSKGVALFKGQRIYLRLRSVRAVNFSCCTCYIFSFNSNVFLIYFTHMIPKLTRSRDYVEWNIFDLEPENY